MSALTLETIAKLAGVSRSTVSRVVRNHKSVRSEVREHVLQVIDETGYQPNAAAQMLAGQRTNIIGLVIAEPASVIFNDRYYTQIIQGVARELNQQNQTLTLFLSHDKSEEPLLAKRLVQNQLIDGVIVCGTRTGDLFVPALLNSTMPFVVIGPNENRQVNFIDIDSFSASKEIVTHLIRLGRKRIGTIAGPKDHPAAISRLQGYKEALQEADLLVDDRLITIASYFTETMGYELTSSLITQSVDAIFAASDTLAFGAMRAIKEAGLLIPDNIAVVGFDDSAEAAMVQPALTTIRQDIFAASTQSVRTLLEVIEHGHEPAKQIYLPTQLIVRESCGSLL